MALNSHVFISYSHEDKEQRDSIISILQKAVGDCLWYDYAGLKPGQDFYTVIADKIEQCQYFVLLLSENSANSDWVSKELSYANDNKKCIVPVILEEVPKDHLPKKMRIIISDIHQIRWYELSEVDFYNIMKNAMNDIGYNANSGANESANESFLTANSDKYRCEFKPSEYDLVKSLLEKEKSGDTVTCMIPENAIILGRAYESGEGVDRNINTALKYYRIARSEDSKEAEFYEARCLLEETDSDTERKKYIDILQKLCDENVVLALNYLGDIYYDGKYVIEDPERAVELWKKSVELHDPEGQYSLAFCMAYGKGTEINQERAYELACISNEKKFPRAARLLGHFYSEGDYVEKDEDRAMTYYQEAAQRGDYFSLCFVGDIYYSRNDYTNAYTYYNEAAERGQPNGKSSLARLYANGLGVEKNIPKAVSLYSDAILGTVNK